MDPVAKALWVIEMDLGGALSVDRISSACGLSRFSLSRVFSLSTGWPLMRYVRCRRLSRAAQALAQGAPDILRVALDAGYGSHEAFTRAFVELFGISPNQLRARRSLEGISLVEPLRMKEMKLVDIGAPRLERGRELLITGISGRFSVESNEGIPALWRAFEPYLGKVPDQVGGVAYGVCFNPDGEGGFEYLAGVQVGGNSRLTAPLRSIRLSPRRYAVFEHRGHVSTVHQTFYTIWNDWLPRSGHKAADAPEFERCSEDFDPVAGTGTLEIWFPIEESGASPEMS